MSNCKDCNSLSVCANSHQCPNSPHSTVAKSVIHKIFYYIELICNLKTGAVHFVSMVGSNETHSSGQALHTITQHILGNTFHRIS